MKSNYQHQVWYRTMSDAHWSQQEVEDVYSPQTTLVQKDGSRWELYWTTENPITDYDRLIRHAIDYSINMPYRYMV